MLVSRPRPFAFTQGRSRPQRAQRKSLYRIKGAFISLLLRETGISQCTRRPLCEDRKGVAGLEGVYSLKRLGEGLKRPPLRP
ncbi:MAG: hypothetical protein DRH43_08715 [Deltaproteobacteria bacterium]|nr:MAG: hypothetical protein DRH43_08715 [Deltaproteobacteria bacterium]